MSKYHNPRRETPAKTCRNVEPPTAELGPYRGNRAALPWGIGDRMPTQPDSSTLWSTRRKRRVATVHRTVAFTWVRVRRYFRCGRQDSTILRCEFRRAGIQQQSTGLLHLHGFEPVAISGAGDRTRLHYGAPGVEPPGGNSPPDCCIYMGSSPLLFPVRATGLEYTMEHPASSRRVATVHWTVAF